LCIRPNCARLPPLNLARQAAALNFSGFRLSLRNSARRKRMEPTHSRAPFFELAVSNLAPAASETNISKFFSRFGDVRRIKTIHRLSEGSPQRCAFLRIGGNASSELTQGLIMEGQTLVIRILEPSESPPTLDRWPKWSRRSLY
jgi:hypothetical protein